MAAGSRSGVVYQIVVGTRLRPLYITRCGAYSIHLTPFTFVMSCRNIDLTNQIIIITVAQIIIMIMTIFIIIDIAMTFDGSNINVFSVCPSAMSDV